MGKVLLTGAGGFIGSHIAELFAQQNIPLKCLVRASGDHTFLQSLGIETITGDITDLSSLISALSDVDFVIHAAGKASDWGRYKDFYEINVKGTLNLMEACKSQNIHDVIITGSISSYGEEDCPIIKSETSPSDSHYPYFLDRIFPSAMNYYRDSKAIQTQAACQFAAANQINLTVIEPAWVYGEREFHTGFYEYLKAVQAGMRFSPGSKTNKFHVVYARDLALAYLAVYQQKLIGVNRIIIGNPEPEKLNDIYTLFCQAANLIPPQLLPKWVTYPIGFVWELAATVLSRQQPPLLSRSRVNMMYDNIGFSVQKAKELMGFEAKTSLQEGINRTVAWYRQNGYI
jgi:nucleoside-diphosphate-sugar epimerase